MALINVLSYPNFALYVPRTEYFEHVFIRHKHIMINYEYFDQQLETFLQSISSHFKDTFLKKTSFGMGTYHL